MGNVKQALDRYIEAKEQLMRDWGIARSDLWNDETQAAASAAYRAIQEAEIEAGRLREEAQAVVTAASHYGHAIAAAYAVGEPAEVVNKAREAWLQALRKWKAQDPPAEVIESLEAGTTVVVTMARSEARAFVEYASRSSGGQEAERTFYARRAVQTLADAIDRRLREPG